MGTPPSVAQPMTHAQDHAGACRNNALIEAQGPNGVGQISFPPPPPPQQVGLTTDGRPVLYSPINGLTSVNSSLLFYGGMGDGVMPSMPFSQVVSPPESPEEIQGNPYAGLDLGSAYPAVGGQGYVLPRAAAGTALGLWSARRVGKRLSRWLNASKPSVSGFQVAAKTAAKPTTLLGRLWRGAKTIVKPLLKVASALKPLARFALPLLGGGLVGSVVMGAMFAKELYDLYRNVQVYRHLRNPDSDEATREVTALDEKCRGTGWTPQSPLLFCAVGHSGGGASVIALANRSNRPDSKLSFRVNKLVLLDSPLTPEHLANIPANVEVIHVRSTGDNTYNLASRLGSLVGLNVQRDPSAHLKPTDTVIEHDAQIPLSSPWNPSCQLFERHCHLLSNWDHVLHERLGRRHYRESVLQIQQTDADMRTTLAQAAQIQRQYQQQLAQPASASTPSVVTWSPPAFPGPERLASTMTAGATTAGFKRPEVRTLSGDVFANSLPPAGLTLQHGFFSHSALQTLGPFRAGESPP